MTARRQRLKAGDLLEFSSSDEVFYVQYVGKHPFYDEVVRVLPKTFEEPQSQLRELVEQTNSYLIFCPVSVSVSRGLATVVGSFPLPAGVEVPTRVRRAVGRDSHGKVRRWAIEGDGKEYFTEELTESERNLVIGAISTHESLLYKVTERWHPSHEGTPSTECDPAAKESVLEADDGDGKNLNGDSDSSDDHHVQHYLYFPTKRTGKRVAERLRGERFDVEDRLGADEENWLVLVKMATVPTEKSLSQMSDYLENIADEYGGEYDGWETAV